MDYFSDRLTLQQICQIPFFKEINRDILENFIKIIEVHNFRKGSYIFDEGSEADAMFFILCGSVKVIKRTFRGNETFLAEINAPDFFGEMALIDRGKRSTSVIAHTDVSLGVLRWMYLDKAFESYNSELAVYTYKKIAQELSLKLRKLNSKYIHIVPEL
ncbi:MAG: cyclic nucleotide-binding domain-containing protein [Bacillus subtilis]|nr:cyclic nucleotide-binding domain-containing protein [Bacillus subtilis]